MCPTVRFAFACVLFHLYRRNVSNVVPLHRTVHTRTRVNNKVCSILQTAFCNTADDSQIFAISVAMLQLNGTENEKNREKSRQHFSHVECRVEAVAMQLRLHSFVAICTGTVLQRSRNWGSCSTHYTGEFGNHMIRVCVALCGSHNQNPKAVDPATSSC